MSVNSLVFSGILSANQMIVIDVNGNIRTALIGEKLPQGTVIVQRGDDISDDAALKTQIIDANNNPQDITDDVARIFAALEEGQDPTQVDEELAPAAGRRPSPGPHRQPKPRPHASAQKPSRPPACQTPQRAPQA
ncbi:hypothetical protein [Vibrio furnissii]|uniref:hypothetical protein n=1 Tax=Vibrio furnissii TaxID=29494 RepID=UPI001EEA5CF5|nr:hypothetical protein [Vibrio furnissii]MCG6269285.1 hypothetical protein [Vibrio furnissii]